MYEHLGKWTTERWATCSGPQRGFTSKGRSRSGLLPFALYLCSLRTLFIFLLGSELCPKLSELFPTLNPFQAHSFFIMEIGNKNRKHSVTSSCPWAFWIRTWSHICGTDVNLLVVWHWTNYSTPMNCSFLMCENKIIPLAGWVANPSCSDSQLHSASSSGADQPHGAVKMMASSKTKVSGLQPAFWVCGIKSKVWELSYIDYVIWVCILFKTSLQSIWLVSIFHTYNLLAQTSPCQPSTYL
jgi:hypothetical protein